MKLTFLGTGTSCGVPVIGCDCAVCHSTDPRDTRMRTSAMVEVDGERILIDCGPDFRQQYLEYIKSGSIGSVLLTHEHYDHVGGLDDLRPLSYSNGMAVYCRKDVAEKIRSNLAYCFGKEHYPGSPVLDLVEIEEYDAFEVSRQKIMPLAVKHGRLDILGYRIGDLGYITDASQLPEKTIECLIGVKVLVINALRDKPHKSHMNLKEALDVIDKVAPERAYLTHMCHDIGFQADIESRLPSGVFPAYDGLTIEV